MFHQLAVLLVSFIFFAFASTNDVKTESAERGTIQDWLDWVPDRLVPLDRPARSEFTVARSQNQRSRRSASMRPCKVFEAVSCVREILKRVPGPQNVTEMCDLLQGLQTTCETSSTCNISIVNAGDIAKYYAVNETLQDGETLANLTGHFEAVMEATRIFVSSCDDDELIQAIDDCLKHAASEKPFSARPFSGCTTRTALAETFNATCTSERARSAFANFDHGC